MSTTYGCCKEKEGGVCESWFSPFTLTPLITYARAVGAPLLLLRHEVPRSAPGMEMFTSYPREPAEGGLIYT